MQQSIRNNASMRRTHDLGFSFFSFHKANRPTPETFTTLKRTPGISPLALPRRPKPEMRTSSLSSRKFRQPSLGTKAVTFFPFFYQLNTNTFTNGGVGLFGFNANFFEDNTLGMRRTSCRGCFIDVTESTLFVGFVGPSIVSTVCAKFTSSLKTTRFI